MGRDPTLADDEDDSPCGGSSAAGDEDRPIK